jgi:hypothetical protein
MLSAMRRARREVFDLLLAHADGRFSLALEDQLDADFGDHMLARDPISDLLQSLATDDQDAIDTLQ